MKRSDCDIIMENFEDLFDSIGSTFETTVNKRTTKMDVVGSLFGVGKNLVKLGFNSGKCIVKHTPEAIVAAASLKREVTETISEEYRKYQREQQEKALLEKIEDLKRKKSGSL